MVTVEDLAILARTTSSPSAQRAFYQTKERERIRDLSLNYQLSPSLWEEIYEHAEGFELTTRLLTHAPTAELADNILTQKDPNIFLAALSTGIKNLKQSSLSKIIEDHLPHSPHIITAIMLSGVELPEELALRVWKESYKELKAMDSQNGYGNGYEKISAFDKILSISTLPTDEEILDFADPESIWYYLVRAVDRRPSLIKAMHARGNPERYYPVTSISRHLDTNSAKEILHYCAANLPTSRDSIYERAALPSTLSRLATNPWLAPTLRLAALALYQEAITTQQLSHLALLGGNVNWPELKSELEELIAQGSNTPTLPSASAGLTHTELEQLTAAVQLRGDWGYYPALLEIVAKPSTTQQGYAHPLLSEEQSAYLDSLGQGGWEIFISLLPLWQQDIPALLFTVAATASK